MRSMNTVRMYQLGWAGKLWNVAVPGEVGSANSDQWTYVQFYVASGGSHSQAMTKLLQLQYPGLGYNAATLKGPVAFSSLIEPGGVADVYESGKSVPSLTDHRGSQRPKPPSLAQGGKGGASDTGGHRRPVPQVATSIGGRPHGPRTTGKGRPSVVRRPTLNATQDKGGWMGSVATNA